jgi:RNA polymerase sigma-70 factor (ECF subfamily)
MEVRMGFICFVPPLEVGAERGLGGSRKIGWFRYNSLHWSGEPGMDNGEQPAVEEVSTLLRAWSGGDQRALERLTPIVYDELHRLAQRYMRRERPGHSLQTTALVNEAYTRLVDYKRMQWQDRAHFFAVSAQLMRRILVEHARRHNLKRGGGVQHVSLDEATIVGGDGDTDLVALDDAMNALAQLDPRKVQVVEMRFFGGLSVEETAAVLKISPVTVKRDWRSARTWLYRELTGATNNGPQTLETS